MLTEKLERARRHISETNDLIVEYVSKSPIRFSTTEEVKDGERWNSVKICEIGEVDPSIQCAIGDSLFNLRSFVDHLYGHVVQKYCNPENIRLDWMMFPVKKDKDAFEKWKTNDQHAKQIPQAVLDTVESFQPYKDAGTQFKKLHDLNNIDKHRSLLIAATNYESINVLSMMDMETISEMNSESQGGESIGRMFEGMMSNLWVRDKNCNEIAKIGQEITAYRVGRTPNIAQAKFNFSLIEDGFEVVLVEDLLNELENAVMEIYQALKPFL